MTNSECDINVDNTRKTGAHHFHLPLVKISIIAPSSILMRILIGLFGWRAAVVGGVTLAISVKIIVIIADVFTIERTIRNKNAIYES